MAAALSEAVKTDRNKLPAAYIDVTTALRFQVKDSRLIFHKVLLLTPDLFSIKTSQTQCLGLLR